MTGEKKPDPAVELLYANIGHLSDPHFGVINLLPFTHDSDHIRMLKKRVCMAIVELFRSNGYPMEVNVKPADTHAVTVNCRKCNTMLLHTRVDDDGVAAVAATNFLSSLKRMDSECPHKVLTLDDQRQRIQDGLLAARREEQARKDEGNV